MTIAGDGKTPRERDLEDAIRAAGFEVIDGDFVRRDGKRVSVIVRPVVARLMVRHAAKVLGETDA